jgi:hypothetical protein
MNNSCNDEHYLFLGNIKMEEIFFNKEYKKWARLKEKRKSILRTMSRCVINKINEMETYIKRTKCKN